MVTVQHSNLMADSNAVSWWIWFEGWALKKSNYCSIIGAQNLFSHSTILMSAKGGHQFMGK